MRPNTLGAITRRDLAGHTSVGWCMRWMEGRWCDKRRDLHVGWRACRANTHSSMPNSSFIPVAPLSSCVQETKERCNGVSRRPTKAHQHCERLEQGETSEGERRSPVGNASKKKCISLRVQLCSEAVIHQEIDMDWAVQRDLTMVDVLLKKGGVGGYPLPP